MDEFTAWLLGVATTTFGVVLGFVLTGTRELMNRQREIRGHWFALRADIIRAGEGARGYLQGGVKVPAGRLPIRSYTNNYPALLMNGLLSEQDIGHLSRFFGNAENFNRSLDYAQEAIGSSADNLDREVKRAILKAGKIAPSNEGKPTQYDAALEIVKKHIENRTGYRLLWW